MDQLEAPEVLLGPARLGLDHALQGLAAERAAAAVNDYGDSASVGMVIHLVGTGAAIKGESVADQCRNEFARGEVPKLFVIDGHRLDCDRHAGFDGDFHLVGRLLRERFAVLQHAFHDHVDDLVNVLERFGLRAAPGGRP